MDLQKTQYNCVLIKVLLDFFQKIAGVDGVHGFNQFDKFKFIEFNINFRQKPYSTLFVIFPIFSISHSTTSPALRNLGGVKPIPTPAGVPVAIIVPALRVIP